MAATMWKYHFIFRIFIQIIIIINGLNIGWKCYLFKVHFAVIFGASALIYNAVSPENNA